MKELSQVRFDALAAYCRSPWTVLASEEVRWYQAYDEAILIVVIRDRADDDYSAMLLARDLKERYRWVEMTEFKQTADEAVAAAKDKVEQVFMALEKERVQGDEKGKPIDFFTPVVPKERLHPHFVAMTTQEGYSPALELIRPMMRWYEDADGNFIEQFQTTGFDTRLWELYLFAAMVEAGYALDRSQAIPDFHGQSLLGELCVEATTINPSRDAQGNIVPTPPMDTMEQIMTFQREYMPIRFAGPLTAKLTKKYWERANVQGLPLVFAIQDFHAPMAMTMSRAGLPIYLYGMDQDWKHEADGKLVITPRQVTMHRWGAKEVPSGFFNLPGAENVSAVIANASATVSKFNRIGVMAGFGSKRVRMIRRGVAANMDPNASVPIPFVQDVNAPDYDETWIEGMDVYHNPNAKYPIDPMMLPGAAHHRPGPDGQVETLAPKWQPMSSHTLITVQE